MAIRQLTTLSLFLSLLMLGLSVDALASTRSRQRSFVEGRFDDKSGEAIQMGSSEMQCSRRNILRQAGLASALMFGSSAIFTNPLPASASSDTLDSYLYKIVRVREATQQERRLITTGKFKDIQRANVKLAVKFMVQNYRLSDSVVGASTFLSGGNSQQMRAIDVGQAAVQNLQTILEYFDSSDVENIKVGQNSMAGKEELVVKGLEATQVKLDEFLAFFDEATVSKVKAQVQEENELNVKEFDRSLGDIINLAPPS
mmetsp:Transcript_15873/g.36606  ORF Transcript_15873/g.36606 Transcript_15873/m.36606 type:complete len:257 (-) Transcript_15873:225-995(-)